MTEIVSVLVPTEETIRSSRTGHQAASASWWKRFPRSWRTVLSFVICVSVAASADGQTEKPRTAFRALQLGYVALDAGDFETAMLHYEKAVELARGDEERHQALFGYGSAALELERYGEARQALEEAHAIKPENAETTLMLGIVCRRQGELDQAVTYLADAATRDPESTKALIEIGIAYGALERHANAEIVCRKALEIEPDNLEARLGLAVALFHQDKYEQAVVEFREVLEGEPSNVRAHYGLGLALLYSGDREGAIEQVGYLNEHSPELADDLHRWIFPAD
jgi:tetratricopeptide (TPR) repeat protein